MSNFLWVSIVTPRYLMCSPVTVSEEPKLSPMTLGALIPVRSITFVFFVASVRSTLLHQSLTVFSMALTLADAPSFFSTAHVMARSSAKAVALTITMFSNLSSSGSYTKFHRSGTRTDTCGTPAVTSCSTVPYWLLSIILLLERCRQTSSPA
ncbi:uncharacterized protein LOC117236605 [Bombus vosnesenskii]|uniref:Uncharacterized protein LOC117236605 n=1 Tax=Bombus vosnesenskii TaxID=207650 RepID=A0A6J3KUP6_9HYME|nr:uncharacterized protein LOC117236605 [Bombus vosnesenskii]